MEKNQERLKVIENIKNAVKEEDFNRKVELGDPVMTEEQREKLILNYDSLKKKFKNKVNFEITNDFTGVLTRAINKNTEIVGLENLKGVKGGIITSNHFHFVDTTIIRYAMSKIHKVKKYAIIVQETNFLMTGFFGWLIRNNKTIPLSLNHKYIVENFEPTIKEMLEDEGFVLIYPEEEMWFNYRKPRPPRPGAYHYAAKYNVPIIPCFTEIVDTDEVGKDGFKKTKYVLHIMPPIYPDKEKDVKINKTEMKEKDYSLKVEAYEKAYGKKLDYSFEESDIAGF